MVPPDGSSTWFQFRISLAETQSLWPWLGDDMQKHIAAWELLAQFALSLTECAGRRIESVQRHNSIELDPASKTTVPWMGLLQTSGILITQVGRKWPSHLRFTSEEKVCCSPPTGCFHRFLFGGSSHSGWSMVDLFAVLGTPHLFG